MINGKEQVKKDTDVQRAENISLRIDEARDAINSALEAGGDALAIVRVIMDGGIPHVTFG